MADLLRVLITDEDLDSRVTVRRAAQRAQLEVVGETGFGIEAVSVALASSPDLVLIAVEEPAARALATAEAIANALPDTPMVIYSSVNTPEAIRRGMVFGARDYLFKPLDAQKVRDAVVQALSQEERRQMRRAGQLADASGRGTVVTVTGAKGGVGKSVLSVNLATALRRATDRSVALLDADVDFGDVSAMLDLEPEHSIVEMMQRRENIDREVVRALVTTHASGVDVLAAATVDTDEWDGCGPEDLKRVIDAFAQIYDFVVVDTGTAFDQRVRACIDSSTLVLVVTSSDVSSVRDTSLALRRMQRWGVDEDRYRVVLNRSTRADGLSRNELSAAVGADVFWEIPHDRAVPPSVQVGYPVVLMSDRSSSATSLDRLARAIAGSQSSVGVSAGASFLKRVLSRKGVESHESNLGTATQRARPLG